MTTRFKIYPFISFFILLTFFSFAQHSEALKTILKNATSDTLRCRILNTLIEDEESEGIWPQYNAEIVRIAENNLIKCPPELRNFYSKYYALGLNNFGFINTNIGKNAEAIDFYFRALKIQNGIDDKSGAATTLVNLGYLMRQQGNITKALECYHSALKLQTEISDKSGMATSYNNIGYVFENQNEIAKCLEYYERSLKINIEIQNKGGLANNYTNIAYIYKSYGEPNCKESKQICLSKSNIKAISYLIKAITILHDINDKNELANCYNLLGGIYNDFGDPKCHISPDVCKTQSQQLALDYFKKALALRQDISDVQGLAQSYYSLANFMTLTKEFKAALGYGLNSMKAAQELNSPECIKDAAFILKTIYSQLHKPAESLKMYELYIQMKDSVYNEETKKSAMKKTFEIEYEKKALADSLMLANEKKVRLAQVKQEETTRYALSGGIILVALFGAFMYNRFKVTQKQNVLIQEQKTELQKQKELVEEHQKETIDSIHYAKRIQTALIANSNFIDEHLPNNFIYFNPKDIVSGDFYWATYHKDKFYLAICDSTGHGVPGAFMSLLNMGFLSEAIKEKHIEKPNEIFNYVRQRLISTISDEKQKDGMDGILVCIDKKKSTIEYCAANNEPILIRNGEIFELPKDKMPVGKGERSEDFTLQTIQLKPGDILYLYTDGFADQFGGPKGKKFKYKQLNELLLSLKDVPLNEQKQIIESTFKNWRGNLEQVDDVLIAGIKMS